MRRFTAEFNFMEVLDVKIEDRAGQVIKDMVEFWMGHEDALRENEGDLVKTFVKQLAVFIIRNGRCPREGDEGWAIPMEQYGITILTWDDCAPTQDDIDITEAKE